MSGFLAMGGYGGYIWSAYGVTVVLIVAECISLAVRRRRARDRLRR